MNDGVSRVFRSPKKSHRLLKPISQLPASQLKTSRRPINLSSKPINNLTWSLPPNHKITWSVRAVYSAQLDVDYIRRWRSPRIKCQCRDPKIQPRQLSVWLDWSVSKVCQWYKMCIDLYINYMRSFRYSPYDRLWEPELHTNSPAWTR